MNGPVLCSHDRLFCLTYVWLCLKFEVKICYLVRQQVTPLRCIHSYMAVYVDYILGSPSQEKRELSFSSRSTPAASNRN